MTFDNTEDLDDEEILDVDDVEVSADAEGGEYEHFRFVADAKQGLIRIDKFIVDRIPHTSRTRVQEAAEAGCIRVDGKPVKQNYKVKPADVITIVMARPRREITIVPEDIQLNIVYEDNDVLVVNKEAGMCVHPGFGNERGTLVNALAWHLKDLPMFADHADLRPGLVHRIDKDTSGLLVVAKTDIAKLDLAQQFFHKTTERSYIALVWGTPEPPVGTIVGNIGRSLQDRKIMGVFAPESNIGKHAVTHYEVVERLGYVSVVRCRLETGRTHQIRAHFKHIGHPLFADSHYGGDQILRGTTFPKYRQFVRNCFDVLPRQALHAQTLGFTHPTTKEFLRFTSDIAADMQQCIERWRTYIESRDAK